MCVYVFARLISVRDATLFDAAKCVYIRILCVYMCICVYLIDTCDKCMYTHILWV